MGRVIQGNAQTRLGTVIGHENGIYFEIGTASSEDTKSGTYEVVGGFVFAGTDNLPEVESSSGRVVAYVDGEDAAVRIQDVTNANTICEVTGITDLVPVSHDMGTVSNLPAAEAYFELQALNTDDTKKKTIVSYVRLFLNGL